MRRLTCFAVTILGTLALALPGLALADNAHGRKVHDQLAKIADSLNGDDELSVIVVGADPGRAADKYGRRGRQLGLVGASSAKVKVRDLDRLANDADVTFVAPDAPVMQLGTVDYGQLSTAYPFADKATKAWDIGLTGQGVGIAVIDSGVAPMAPFGTRLVQVRMPWQADGSSLDDVHGHGTLVAGLAAMQSGNGKYIGIAPGATIYAINVNRPEGTRSSDVIEGLGWVFDHAGEFNIRVVNLSLGETIPSSYTQSALDLAVERLWAKGVAVVVSAGNAGPGVVDYAPANDPLAITVGSSDDRGTKAATDDTLAPFTSVGVTADGYAKPELLAPGRLVASLVPAGSVLDLQAPAANRLGDRWVKISGTSFSAPQVAGAAAIVLQQHPEWSPDNVKWILAKKGHTLLGTTIPALSLNFVDNFAGSPGRANQGVMALVCAPGSVCLPDTGMSTLSSSWNSSSWNSSSWNSSSWNSSSWNSSSWNSSSWNSSSWNSSSWNSSSWNSSSWNSSSWNSSSWNSFGWD